MLIGRIKKEHSYKQLSKLNKFSTYMISVHLKESKCFTYHFNAYLLPRRFLFIIEGADAHSDLDRFSLSHNLLIKSQHRNLLKELSCSNLKILNDTRGFGVLGFWVLCTNCMFVKS